MSNLDETDFVNIEAPRLAGADCSDAACSRSLCRYCGWPEANDYDWETIPEGEGNHLCWGECDKDAEAALTKIICQKEVFRAAITRALMHLDTNYDIDGNSMRDSDAARILRDAISSENSQLFNGELLR